MRLHATRVQALATLAALALGGCSRPAQPPAPSPRIVYVVVTATPVPEDAAPAELAPVPFEHAEQTFPIPPPEPSGPRQNELEAPPEPPPAEAAPRRTLHDEMMRCLTFTLEKDGAVAVSTGVQLKVTARNQCATSFAESDLRVDVRARPWSGTGVAAREIISFQGNVAPYGSAVTYVILHCDPDKSFRFEAVPSPSAGADRRLGQ